MMLSSLIIKINKQGHFSHSHECVEKLSFTSVMAEK